MAQWKSKHVFLSIDTVCKQALWVLSWFLDICLTIKGLLKVQGHILAVLVTVKLKFKFKRCPPLIYNNIRCTLFSSLYHKYSQILLDAKKVNINQK